MTGQEDKREKGEDRESNMGHSHREDTEPMARYEGSC